MSLLCMAFLFVFIFECFTVLFYIQTGLKLTLWSLASNGGLASCLLSAEITGMHYDAQL